MYDIKTRLEFLVVIVFDLISSTGSAYLLLPYMYPPLLTSSGYFYSGTDASRVKAVTLCKERSCRREALSLPNLIEGTDDTESCVVCYEDEIK